MAVELWTIFQELANPKIDIWVLSNIEVEPESDVEYRDNNENHHPVDEGIGTGEHFRSPSKYRKPWEVLSLQVGVPDEVFMQLSGIDELTTSTKTVLKKLN